MEEKLRRPRRTFASIENDIMEATKELIEENGITNLTLRSIAKKAKIEASVFYNRYNGLHDLLEKFIERYDYWYSDIVNSFDKIRQEEYKQYFEQIFISLIKSLDENKSMQQILLWELMEDNNITRHTNKMREDYTKDLVKALEENTKDDGRGINTRVISAMLLSSIYFLIIHKGKATFCGIDFSTKEGQDLLADTITKLSSWIFSKKKDIFEVALKMKEKGIDIDTIAECTGLSAKEIELI